MHDGALPADSVDYRDELLKIVLGAGVIDGIVLKENAVYDFDLEQWGCSVKTPSEYIDRVFGKSRDVDGSATRFWQSTDNCLYDLSVEASQLQNAWVKSSANVYYASYATNEPQKMRVPGSVLL